MKKKRLDLNKLEVKSFVTSIENGSKETIQGGKYTEQIVCTASGVCVCDTEDCDTEILCFGPKDPIRPIKPIIITKPWRF